MTTNTLVAILVFLYFLVATPFYLKRNTGKIFYLYLLAVVVIVSSLIYITGEWSLCGFMLICAAYHTCYELIYSKGRLQ